MATRRAKTGPKASKKTGRASHPRKLKGYHPRKSSAEVKLSKQQLIDLEHRISADIGSYLVLLEEGSAEQIVLAAQRARSDRMKFGSDMQKIAAEIGGNLPRLLEEFLNSIDNILHTGVNWIDEAKIRNCYQTTQRLEEALHAKKAA